MKKKIIFIFTSFLILNLALLYYLDTTNFKSDNVIVAVLDSGIDPSHELFSDNLITGIDLVARDFSPLDNDGHGTHVAGIIAKKAPEAKILPIRILNDDGILTTPFTSIAIVYAIISGADVINMSFSTTELDFLTNLAIKFGERKDVVFVGSAGNNNNDKKLSFPGKLKEVITVGALDQSKLDLYKTSNFGEEINFLAPGANIRSAAILSGSNAYTMKSGTSMAAAHISETIAYLKTVDPQMSKDEIIGYLNKNSFIVDADRPYKTVEFKKIKTAKAKDSLIAKDQ